MARASLLGGAYSSASLIAALQRCVNLYPESVPEKTKEGVQAVHLLRPGRRFLSGAPSQGRGRCLYGATNGDAYAVVDTGVYYIDPNFVWTLLGNLLNSGNTPVYMADNGIAVLIVDGSPNGYSINLTTRVFTQIGDPNFLGSDRVDEVDSFLVFNNAGTGNWGATLSNQIAFNALDFGSLTAWPGTIQTLVTIAREVWLLGQKKGEIWYNAGLQGFPFQGAPGVIIEHGCGAKYSIAKQDVKIYWLSQSPEGNRMVMTNEGRTARRISTHAMEAEFKKYPKVDDAIGGCFQIEGHAFYALHFPTADKTWVHDEAVKEWHEENYCDTNGVLHRMRDSFYCLAYDQNLSLDWATGTLYAIDPQTYTDQITATTSAPIAWVRSLPHMLEGKFERVTWDQLVADVEVGNDPGTISVPLPSGFSSGFSSGFGGSTIIAVNPLISLRWSDDRGGSFGNKVVQNLGKVGEYNTTVTWWNLGMARDKIFELSGASNQKFSLLGVFTDHQLHET